MCRQQDLQDDYKRFLEELARKKSPKLFTNGGKEYASILMSVLLDNTNSIARIFSQGFRPNLVWTSPYREALISFLESSDKRIHVMVEQDSAIEDEPIAALKEAFSKKGDRVALKLITEEDKRSINKQFGGHSNFAVFDNDKFRMEYDPDRFRAFGSFNAPSTCERLIEIFDKAFDKAKDLLR